MTSNKSSDEGIMILGKLDFYNEYIMYGWHARPVPNMEGTLFFLRTLLLEHVVQWARYHANEFVLGLMRVPWWSTAERELISVADTPQGTGPKYRLVTKIQQGYGRYYFFSLVISKVYPFRRIIHWASNDQITCRLKESNKVKQGCMYYKV